MDRISIKQNLEDKILSIMLNDLNALPYVCSRLNEGDFSDFNKGLFNVLSTANIQAGQPDKLIEPEAFILNLAKKNIPGFGLADLLKLKNSESFSNLESLIYNNWILNLKDVNYSFNAEKFLEKSLNEIKNDFSGLDTLYSLQSSIEQKLKETENFVEEKSFGKNLQLIMNEIEGELNNTENNSFIVKSMPSFNNATGGLRPSNLVGIAGSYKSGKTTLGLNIIFDFAGQNIPCGFFSLELSESEINRKILGMLAKVEYENLREPKKLNDNERKELIKTCYNTSDFPLYISDRPMTETELRAKARYWHDRHGVKIICIDYIGYLRSVNKFENRERELSHYSTFLKSLAKELGIVVIVLAQLNREGKLKPATENLAESIALARDCDFLFVVFNPVELGMKKEGSYAYSESDFMVKLDTTRHTRNRKQFLLRLNNSGNFVEIVSEYDNKYLAGAMAGQEYA